MTHWTTAIITDSQWMDPGVDFGRLHAIPAPLNCMFIFV